MKACFMGLGYIGLPTAIIAFSISIMNHWLFPSRQVEQLIVYTMSPGLKTPSGKKSLC